MRNFKRFLALVLAMLMLNGMMVFSAGAAEAGDYTDAAKRLSTVGILKGDGAGNLMLGAPVKRWQTALFFIQVLTGETDAADLNAQKTSANFTDVVEYGTAIDQAFALGVVKGRGNGIYGYNDNIIYQDMLVMAVRALGYETSEMQYPYGHFIAAEKLGLTENMAKDVTMDKPLTRGETAQIIWNTLTTQIAFEDPITKKIIYPDEPIPTQSLIKDKEGNSVSFERETFLERSEFAQDTIEAVVVDFTAATRDVKYDRVTLMVDGDEYELAADDLGIDDYTYKSSFLGLPITMYVDCEAEKFFDLYDVDDEYTDANVVFTSYLSLDNVKNIGSEGNIRYVEATDDNEAYFYLDGTKYAADDYAYDIRIFTMDGWVEDDDDTLTENFLWTKKDGYIGFNSYGEIDYTVITDENNDKTLLMLYTPYEFGRYAERAFAYQPSSSAYVNFVTIATYVPGVSYTNPAGTPTKFVERTLGENGVEVMYGTSNVSKKAGELSLNVELGGEEVATGDFIFYSYNELDNYLYVAYNCGATKTARLTSYSDKNETVKIGGTTYKFGFDGAYENDLPEFSDYDINGRFLSALEAKQNNVHCITAGDRVLYMTEVDNHDDANHGYLVISIDEERMAELLDMEVEEYREAVEDTLGVYLDKDGNVKVALLDLRTATWSLTNIEYVERGAYTNVGDDENPSDSYEFRENLKEHFENFYFAGTGYTRYDNLTAAVEILDDGIVMLRGIEKNGYSIAAINDNFINYGTGNSGLRFSDKAAVTNKITAFKGGYAARVALNADSVIVIIDANGNIGVRTGIQRVANDVIAAGRFYTATNALIVFQLNGEYDVAAWESAQNLNARYFVATGETDVAVERTEEGGYILDISNLFDLGNLETVASTAVEVETLDRTDLDTDVAAGTVIYYDGEGNYEIRDDLDVESALLAATNDAEDDDDEFFTVDIDSIDFDDHESISIEFVGDVTLDKDDAVSYIDIMLATLNFSDVDLTKYDVTDMAYDFDGDPVPEFLEDVSKVRLTADNSTDKAYSYAISGMGQTVAVSTPTSGKFDNYVLGTLGEELLLAKADGSYFDDSESVTVNLVACGRFDKKDGTVTLYIVKMLENYE